MSTEVRGCVPGCQPTDHERLDHTSFLEVTAGLHLTRLEQESMLSGWERAVDRLAPTLRYVRAEAEERARIATASTNQKGALEIAVVGLWNIEGECRKALGLDGPSEVERMAALR